MNKVQVKVEKDASTGASVLKEEAQSLGEALNKHCTPGKEHAKIEFQFGRALPYAELKITATVTLHCNQSEEALDHMAWECFQRAKMYCDQAFDHELSLQAAVQQGTEAT